MVHLLVNVDVDDIERAIEFYRAEFGLHLGRRLFDGSVAEMRGASSMIYLAVGDTMQLLENCSTL